MTRAHDPRENLAMSTRRSPHHVVNVNWVQIAVRTPLPITADEAHRIAVRAYLNTITGKISSGQPAPG